MYIVSLPFTRFIIQFIEGMSNVHLFLPYFILIDEDIKILFI